MQSLDQLFDEATQHFRAGRLREAETIFSKIVEQDARHSEAWHMLAGIAVRERGSEVALERVQHAIDIAPQVAIYHASRGLILSNLGRTEQAIDALHKATSLDPNFADAFQLLGAALREAGRPAAALSALGRALQLNPDSPAILNDLGLAWEAGGSPQKAAEMFHRALELRPDYATALSNLGHVLHQLGRGVEAIQVLRRAVTLDPSLASAHLHLANALGSIDQSEQAIAEFRKAVELDPNLAAAWTGLGSALCDHGQLHEAEAAHRKALSIRPDYPEARLNLALALLLRGNFEQGLPLYEARKEVFVNAKPTFTQPAWDGSPLSGRWILLHAEQGLGDTIQFIRYAPLIAARGGRVIARCQAGLKRLFEMQSFLELIIAEGDPLPRFDVHASLLSLPHLLGTTLSTIPAKVPYLDVKPASIEAWKKRVSEHPARLNVGLAWAGNPNHPNDRHRSLRLDDLSPLAQVDGARFVSLQLAPRPKDRASGKGALDLTDWSSELSDMADTAALMCALDVIVTVDTAIAHLAGALGRPTFVLLPFAPDWRWMRDREDSPWYPTLRLFRQSKPLDWQSPIEQGAAALRQFQARGSAG